VRHHSSSSRRQQQCVGADVVKLTTASTYMLLSTVTASSPYHVCIHCALLQQQQLRASEMSNPWTCSVLYMA
jgi:hypothetical protein